MLHGRASRFGLHWELFDRHSHLVRIVHLYLHNNLDSPVVCWEHMMALAIERTTCLCRFGGCLRCARHLNLYEGAAAVVPAAAPAARLLVVLGSASVADRHVDLVLLVVAASFSTQVGGRKLCRDTCRQICLRLRSRVPTAKSKC
jgi:uncharacterized membrane protein